MCIAPLSIKPTAKIKHNLFLIIFHTIIIQGKKPVNLLKTRASFVSHSYNNQNQGNQDWMKYANTGMDEAGTVHYDYTQQ